MFTGKSSILFLICIFYIGLMKPGIVRIDTIRTVDNKKVTFLADNHGCNERAEEQLAGILELLQHNEKMNKPTHILIEQVSWLADIYGCDAKVLFSLPKQIEQAIPKMTQTTFENIDIRHVANFAIDILTFLIPHQMDREPTRIIDTTQKTLSTLNFQDMLDEFNQIKESLSEYYSQQNNTVMSEIYTKHMTWADAQYKKLLEIMKKDNISADTFILKYAKKNCLMKKAPLATAVKDTFSRLCDLHIIRTLASAPDKNMVVMAGFWHTQYAESALKQLGAYSLYSEGKAITEYARLISSAQLRQGLFAEKQPLMKMYAPMVTKSATAIVLCCFLYATILHMFT